ncbi:hypothetical protein EDD11_003389 [Mortierella claussenii]|nr:hypothetical protein EDD11_003389 [Mortierella claussenii]
MSQHLENVITEEDRRRFHRDGFLIVKNALTPEEVAILHREAENLMNFLMTENVDIMRDLGGIIEPIPCGYIDPPVSQMYILSKRSYSNLRNMVTEDPDTVVPILFEKMPSLVRHFLPAETPENPVCLFNEQYIIKSPKTAPISSFEWHQANGTLLIEPFPQLIDPLTGKHSGLPDGLDSVDVHLDHHIRLASLYGPPLDRDEALAKAQSKRGIDSSSASVSQRQSSTPTSSTSKAVDTTQKHISELQQPVLVDIPAGTIVFLSGFVRHCSLGNASLNFRRAYMPQFSAGKVESEDGGLVSLAVPCSDHWHE